MFLQIFRRLEHPVPFFRRDKRQLGAACPNRFLDRLDPSHALNAVRSPRPPQEFQNQRPPPQESRKCQDAIPVRCLQRKLRRTHTHFQGFRVIEHLVTDCKTSANSGQPANTKRTTRDTVLGSAGILPAVARSALSLSKGLSRPRHQDPPNDRSSSGAPSPRQPSRKEFVALNTNYFL